MAVNRDNSLAAFKEAMRERLILDDPSLAGNVDLPDVEKNLDALGHAVLDILTINAEVRSSTLPPSPQDFWAWINQVQAYLEALEAWRVQLELDLVNWDDTAPPPTALGELKTALSGIAPPAAPPPALAPSQLTGRIE